MCFRPADAGVGPVKCSCGKMVFPAEGVLPSKCPFCKQPLEPGTEPPTMPSAPAAPGVQSAGRPTPPPPTPTPAAPRPATAVSASQANATSTVATTV